VKTNRYVALLSMFAFACLARPADAADRMRAGQGSGRRRLREKRSLRRTA
jgi:hypothetical protein